MRLFIYRNLKSIIIKMDNYKLSVAIVTRNRPDSLAKTLDSLLSQSIQPYEIVISDDSNTENFSALNKTIADKKGCKYVIGPQKGLYANRNHVVKCCTGTHIRTMDDDHTFPEGHIDTCMRKIEEDPTSIWIMGEWYPNAAKDSAKPHCPGEIHPRGFSAYPKDEQNCRAISCGATIYPRIVIDRNILNIEDFKFGYSYLEYGCRLRYFGFRIRHLDDTYVYHEYYNNPPSIDDQYEMLDSQVFAMMALSFIYEPTFKNRFYTIIQLSIGWIRSKTYMQKSILQNIQRIKRLKKSLESLNEKKILNYQLL